jgi:hypothetical protein
MFSDAMFSDAMFSDEGQQPDQAASRVAAERGRSDRAESLSTVGAIPTNRTRGIGLRPSTCQPGNALLCRRLPVPVAERCFSALLQCIAGVPPAFTGSNVLPGNPFPDT